MMANYSNSSMKLLEKVLLIALNLERRGIIKFPSINFNSSSKRRLLLFSALSLISGRLGPGGSKLLQLDWLTDILGQVLCHVKFEISIKVLKVSGGLEKLCQDLSEARKLQALQFLRATLRRDAAHKLKISFQDLQFFLLVLEQRKRLQASQLQVESNAKLEQELASLRLEDPTLKSSVLKRFMHIWRCVLNLRLVKARTRRRFKTAIVGKWRKSTRISTITGIYYGKKVKLRLMNRWFSKRFGRAKEQQLITRLNDFIARKKRRAMFLTKDQVTQSHSLTAKGLFQIWRSELNGRKAETLYQTRLVQRVYRRLTGSVTLNQGRAQTSRLYSEIRLLKNFFYTWFTSAIPDRFAFSRDRMLLARNEIKIKRNSLMKWQGKVKNLEFIQKQSDQLQVMLESRKLARTFASWRLLTKHHTSRIIWTDNFRFTEDLRFYFHQWRLSSKNQITADTKYQFNLCKTALSAWRGLFEAKQDRRFQLKKTFSLWKSFSQGLRGLRFLSGQRLLRKLTRLKASNSAISSALEHANDNDSDSIESIYSTKIIRFAQWKDQLKRGRYLQDLGDSVVFEKFRKLLQIWRLKTAHSNVIRSEPIRIKMKTFTLIQKHLNSERERIELLDTQLFHYYTQCAVKLESKYFHSWESAFQVTQVGEHCCAQVLKRWEAQKRFDLFHSWQLQTAGIIFGKCKRITEQQGVFTIWRNSCTAERTRRSKRIVSKHFQFWRQAHRNRNLENREIRFRHSRTKLQNFSLWRQQVQIQKQSWNRSDDFFFIVRTSKCLDLWKQKLDALRLTRAKTQNLLLLRAPLVRKPRIEQLMANAMSLSDLSATKTGSKDENGDHLIMENLNIAELSV